MTDPLQPVEAKDEVPGIRRGACPKCLGPARSLYTRVDLSDDDLGRGSFAIRGVVWCLGSSSLVTLRGEELVNVGETVLESTPQCCTCGSEAVSLAFQVAREWRVLESIEACRTEGVIRSTRTGAAIRIPAPIPHSLPTVPSPSPPPLMVLVPPAPLPPPAVVPDVSAADVFFASFKGRKSENPPPPSDREM